MPETSDSDLRKVVQAAILDTVARAQWRGPDTQVHLAVSPDMVKFMPTLPPGVQLFTTDSSIGKMTAKAVVRS